MKKQANKKIMGKIDILLIRPYSEIPIQTPPLGLGYLAATLKKDKLSVEIKDCLLDRISIEEIASFLRENRIKIAGISCCTDELLWVNKLIDNIKSVLDCKIIVGGPHPSCVLEGIFTDLNKVDFSIYSEGEMSISLLVRAILEGDLSPQRLSVIPNLIWKDGTKVIKNESKLINSLDSIDFPSWDLINPKRYSKKIPHGFLYKASPFAPMIATRGCSYSCNFCSTAKIHGHKVRTRGHENIISEIRYLTENFGVKEVFFEDDNLAFDGKYIKELCGKIISSKLGVFFSLPNGIRLENVDEEALILMRKANFYSFAVGIESGSQKTLQRMGKNTDLDRLEKKIYLVKKHGFYITGFFILGYPGETLEDIELTIKYACKINIDKAAFSKYFPLPGTQSYEDLASKGEIRCRQYFEGLSIKDIPYSPQGISRDQLRNCLKNAIVSFYFRPSVLLRNINKIRFNQILPLCNIFKRFS
jgi:radical SAM superfamily enzyme YgiQ (UPF0313 family)